MKAIAYTGAALVGVALVYTIYKRRPGESFATAAGREVVGVVADAANGAVTAAVVGAGKLIGVPETNQDQCSRDLAAGRRWDASFSCDARRFIKSFGSTSNAETPVYQSTTINHAARREAWMLDQVLAGQDLTGVYVDGEKVEQYDQLGNRIY